jgi:ribosomal protein S18 acetylase RimI-like enzyme
MALNFAIATEADAPGVSAVRNAAAERLTQQYGPGHWSWGTTERAVLRDLSRPRFSRTLIARDGNKIIGALLLQTKKPWAIDVSYFTSVPKPLYLLGMAVHPDCQRQKIGRLLLEEAEAHAREWPAQAIRLDAFDAAAGAGGFYSKCGYREVGRVVYRNSPLIYFELVL